MSDHTCYTQDTIAWLTGNGRDVACPQLANVCRETEDMLLPSYVCTYYRETLILRPHTPMDHNNPVLHFQYSSHEIHINKDYTVFNFMQAASTHHISQHSTVMT